MEVAKVKLVGAFLVRGTRHKFSPSRLSSLSEGGPSRGVPCVNCGHTRREEAARFPCTCANGFPSNAPGGKMGRCGSSSACSSSLPGGWCPPG